MVRTFLQFIILLSILGIVLTFEAVIGLPIVFFATLGLMSAIFRDILWWPLLLLTLLSVVLAISYQIPIVFALLLLIGLTLFTSKGASIIERKALRVVIAVLFTSLLLVFLSPIGLVEINLLTVLIQGTIVFLALWRVIGIPIITDQKEIKRLGRE